MTIMFWKSLLDVVLMMSKVMCRQVRLLGAQGAAGSGTMGSGSTYPVGACVDLIF